MYEKLYIIALIPVNNCNNSSDGADYTLYLFEKKQKYIVPVEVDSKQVINLIEDEKVGVPNIYNTLLRLTCGLGGRIISSTVYKYDNGRFYTYLNVIFQNKHLEFNIHLLDAVNLSKRFESPIYIRSELLDKCGIKVSKKILRDALNDGY